MLLILLLSKWSNNYRNFVTFSHIFKFQNKQKSKIVDLKFLSSLFNIFWNNKEIVLVFDFEYHVIHEFRMTTSSKCIDIVLSWIQRKIPLNFTFFKSIS